MTVSAPVFRPLDASRPVHVYRRNLPHWRQEGATYFVTFRLADSIPREVLEAWLHADRIWFRANGIYGPLSDPRWRTAYDRLSENSRKAFERSTAHRLHVELDICKGSCVLEDPDVAALLAAAMDHFHGTRLWMGDSVIMPNHVHALVQPISSHTLENLLGSIKGYVSKRLTSSRIKAGRLWQRENYDRIVRNREELKTWRKYIRDNPAKLPARSSACLYRPSTWLDEAAPL